MTIIHKAAIAAVLATCAVSPATAGGPVRSTVSARIKTADLDLSHAAGRHGLHRRLSVAARRACGTAQAQWHEKNDAERCYREMMTDGTNQIAALTPAKRVELASIDRR
jgi:UrcA family protein